MADEFSDQDVEDLKQLQSVLAQQGDPRAARIGVLLKTTTRPPNQNVQMTPADLGVQSGIPVYKPDTMQTAFNPSLSGTVGDLFPHSVAVGGKPLAQERAAQAQRSAEMRARVNAYSQAVGQQFTQHPLATAAEIGGNAAFPGAGEVARGIGELTQAGNRVKGATRVLAGTGEAATVAGGPSLLAGAVARPVATALTMAGGQGLSSLSPAQHVARALGGDAEAQGLGSELDANLPLLAGIALHGLSSSGKPLSPEESALSITKAVNPPRGEWPNFIKTVQNEGGNVKAFAARNNMPLGTIMDFAKAARGAAQERYDSFKSQFLDPVADKTVDVGTNYRGRQTGSYGIPKATLSDINARIGEINKELTPVYNKRTGELERTAAANEADLIAEQAHLTDRLEQTLADAHGTTPGQIQNLRQSFGRLFSVADKSEGAVYDKMAAARKMAEGRTDVPTTFSGLALNAFNHYGRGGPVGIADRAFRGAIGQSQVPPSGVPVSNPPTPVASLTRTPITGGSEAYPTFMPLTAQEQQGITASGSAKREETLGILRQRLADSNAAQAARTAKLAARIAATKARQRGD